MFLSTDVSHVCTCVGLSVVSREKCLNQGRWKGCNLKVVMTGGGNVYRDDTMNWLMRTHSKEILKVHPYSLHWDFSEVEHAWLTNFRDFEQRRSSLESYWQYWSKPLLITFSGLILGWSDPFTIVRMKGTIVLLALVCHHFSGFIRKTNMLYTREL